MSQIPLPAGIVKAGTVTVTPEGVREVRDFHSTGLNLTSCGELACLWAAANLLHGQPFGFTWEDVNLIRGCVIRAGREFGHNPELYDLADRIAALLPPRENA